MGKPCVILSERTGKWATAIGRHLPRDVRLRQTRALAECAAQLAADPTSLVALELTQTNLADVLDLVSRLPVRFPLARAVILADDRLKACEGLLREAGAVHFTASTRQLGGLTQIIRSHFGRMPAASQDAGGGVWDMLPWSESATA